jgi:hypothetical protein
MKVVGVIVLAVALLASMPLLAGKREGCRHTPGSILETIYCR